MSKSPPAGQSRAELPSYRQAAATVAAAARAILQRSARTRTVNLASSLGSILAEPVHTPFDMPAFPRSTRDGFAVRAAEASAHRQLAIAGSIRAGDPPAGPLPPESAWEIMTGAAVPSGADAVAMLEHVENSGSSIRLSHKQTLDPGENMVGAAAEARAGDQLIPPGTRLSPAHIAAAATCGYARIKVFSRPRVAILTTGDELVPVDAEPAAGQIRNSNAPMLAALVTLAGGDPWVLPAASDSSEALDRAFSQAVQAPLMLISGGVSAGKFDLVEPALSRLGAQFHFTGVRIQPGKPLVFAEIPHGGKKAATQVFGLPGNPISSACTFLLFAAPILAALAGSCGVVPHFFAARLSKPVKGKPSLTRFVPSILRSAEKDGDLASVAPVGTQGSGDLAAFARANCFLAVPEGTERLQEGEIVRILAI